MDILADILRPSLRDDDFNMEKKVIIEEIGMYEDQPNWSAYDHAKKHYFADHPLGNSILGTPASITALERERMVEYHRRRYVAPNILAAAAGNFEWGNFVGLVEKACGVWENGPIGRENVRPAVGSRRPQVIPKEKVSQEHVVLMSVAGAGCQRPCCHAADTLALVVGDDSGSRLYWALVDPGLAESADMRFHDYEGTGKFYTQFSGDPEQSAENLALVQGILREAQKKGITAEELEQAKNKIASRESGKW